jgi:UV DNA damage endonuclease
MRIGYPCINRTIGCTANSTFRLKSYSESRLKQTIRNNLDCLRKIVQFNVEHGLLFFRISSDLIPFASHPVNEFNWQKHFKQEFEAIGEFIKKNKIRISMHPDQFTLINSVKEDIFERSKKELEYHAELLDLMKLDASAKIQIHVGGVYGDKKKSMERFVKRYEIIDNAIRQRLVIENDDRLFDLSNCLQISKQTTIPVLLDVFHHKLNNEAQIGEEYFELAAKTWELNSDGVPMVDYSSPKPNGLPQQHSETIDLRNFSDFLKQTQPFDFDIMLEIKDKEKSAIQAIEYAMKDPQVQSLLVN